MTTSDRPRFSQPYGQQPGLHYTGIAILFHWVLAIAIIGSLGLGLYMSGLPLSPARLKLINYHKWAGVTILVLSALRLLWRLTHTPPADVPMPGWQQKIAHATHLLLYLLFFATPLVGWAYSSAAGYPVVWFGIVPLPDLVSPDKELAATLKGAHALLAYALAALVTLHIAGALKHQLVDRDGLIGRMWPA